MAKPESITIRISKSSQGRGYFYDIFKADAISYNADELGSDDGGECTSPSMKTAIDMACDQAKDLIK